ncbi:MAG: glycosyltransferase [Clostridiales bacterium]|nr:glycosyltransferase [Clostridiales bacterium]
MTITVVCDVLGKENNGTTVAAMNLIRFLKAQGHTVRILCGDQDRIGDEDVFVVPDYDFGALLNAYVEKVGVTIAKPEAHIIRQALTGADVVHIMVPLSLGIKAAKIAREMNIPVTAGFHMQAENLTSYLKLNKIKPANDLVYLFIYDHLYKHVSAIHYPTEFIKNVFEHSVRKSTPAYVISNGVHSYVQKREQPKPEEYKDKIVILSVGRLAREKSQDTLLKAIKYSRHKDEIQLIFGGIGPKEKYYKKLAQDLPVAPVFNFYSRTDIIDVINYCDIYVHSAEIELEGIACLEAIACGKLTIVSDSKLAATKEFAVDEKCIFKCRNPKDLARVIDFWIENPELKKEYEKKYLEKSIVFNQDECMKRMEQMLIDVVTKHNNTTAE